MSRFLEELRSGRVLLMDGAMGTELQRAGIQEGECYELWNLTQPEKVRAIHQAYVDAGAEMLLTNTFQANTRILAQHHLRERLAEINQAGVTQARTAAGADRFVLASIGPFPRETPLHEVAEPIRSLVGGDGILLETASDVFDLVHILKQCTLQGDCDRMPVLFSWTFRRNADGSLGTVEGLCPEACARLAQKYPITALGANCGRDIGMDEMIEVVRRYRQVTDLPLFARPNAGTPTRVGDRWVYPHTPEQMAARLPELLEAGVSMVGGCCGTTPAHIAAFRRVVDEWNRSKKSEPERQRPA